MFVGLFGKLRKDRYLRKKFKPTILSLEKIVGYKINHPEYYLKALTHRSSVNAETELDRSNERLEFLGDAVLDLIVGEFLFSKFPEKDEGFLTKNRSKMVDKEALSKAGHEFGLDKIVFYKKNFVGTSKAGIKTIVADALEALIGAIYLDKGLNETKRFVTEKIIKPSVTSGEIKKDKNYKGQLLELTHVLKTEPPVYKITGSEGPEHNKIFHAKVFINGEEMGSGSGKNKKGAEQKAASVALKKLEKTDE